ncbi:unnamed protein product [Paramecium pentaurelia]|uniref:Uncharacterized protein n=1 Tax=Paramecium pentaurelia TaxID=43138 RepID=A0A8S1TE80_9CILI|nr:unnamed protein product [Paramecium pentaurelia]
MQQQQKKQSWIQQLFCGCIREEPLHQDKKIQGLSSKMEIQKQKPVNLIFMQQQSEGWLNKTTSQEVDYSADIEKDVDLDEDQQKVYNRQLSYLEQNSQLQKTSFSDEFNSNNIEMKLFHRIGGLLSRQSNIQVEMQSNLWIMKIFKDVQLIVQDKEFEQKFKSQLINPAIVDIMNQRIKSNIILLAHDPTGSILLKLASPSRKIQYIQQEQTFSNIIDRGICKLKVKVDKVFKMDLDQKVDIVIVNLYYVDSKDNLKNIMYEYLQYAHDIIILLQPNIENSIIYDSAEQAISLSEQSNQSCSVELQCLMDNNNNIIAKLLYYGDITEITLNDELNFVYSCIDSSIKKQYNYKLMFRDLRNQMGMNKLIRILNQFQIISGIGSFSDFILSINGSKNKYLLMNIQTKDFENENQDGKHKLSELQSSSSSTESEPEDNLDKIDSISESYNQSQILEPLKSKDINSQPFNN